MVPSPFAFLHGFTVLKLTIDLHLSSFAFLTPRSTYVARNSSSSFSDDNDDDDDDDDDESNAVSLRSGVPSGLSIYIYLSDGLTEGSVYGRFGRLGAFSQSPMEEGLDRSALTLDDSFNSAARRRRRMCQYLLPVLLTIRYFSAVVWRTIYVLLFLVATWFK